MNPRFQPRRIPESVWRASTTELDGAGGAWPPGSAYNLETEIDAPRPSWTRSPAEGKPASPELTDADLALGQSKHALPQPPHPTALGNSERFVAPHQLKGRGQERTCKGGEVAHSSLLRFVPPRQVRNAFSSTPVAFQAL